VVVVAGISPVALGISSKNAVETTDFADEHRLSIHFRKWDNRRACEWISSGFPPRMISASVEILGISG
jgi:hypothetical protein